MEAVRIEGVLVHDPAWLRELFYVDVVGGVGVGGVGGRIFSYSFVHLLVCPFVR